MEMIAKFVYVDVTLNNKIHYIDQAFVGVPVFNPLGSRRRRRLLLSSILFSRFLLSTAEFNPISTRFDLSVEISLRHVSPRTCSTSGHFSTHLATNCVQI